MKRNLSLAVGLVVVAILVAPGCKKLTGPNTLPTLKSVSFNPPSVMPGETVTAVVNVTDKDGDKFEVEYEWLADGQKLKETGSSVSTKGYAGGVKFTVRFRAKELPSGRLTDWQEKIITLGAPAPVTIKGVRIEPVPLTAGQNPQAVIDYGEAEPNDLTFYYRWTINGKEMEGDQFHGPELAAGELKRGDRVVVSICEDEEFKGPVWDAQAMTVVGNPPVFTTEPYMETEGDNIEIKFEAEDPNGDPITYSITGAPSGTTRTKNGYQINTRVAAPGEYAMTIKADDGTGASASFEMTLTIPERTAPTRSAPAPEPESPEPAAPEPTAGGTASE